MAPSIFGVIASGGQQQDSWASEDSEMVRLQKWVPPSQDKPRERPLVRKVLKCAQRLKPKEPDPPELETDFRVDCLKWHNHYRSCHKAPPLELDQELCESAQNWANILGQRDAYFHQNLPEIGENIFSWPVMAVSKSTPSTKRLVISGKEVAFYWYKTMRNYYFFKKPSLLHAHASQFSQMVWASSTRFGCGKSRSRTGKTIVVAHYYPRGNLVGKFHENVFPAIVSVEPLSEEGENENGQDEEGDGKEENKKPVSRSSSMLSKITRKRFSVKFT